MSHVDLRIAVIPLTQFTLPGSSKESTHDRGGLEDGGAE